MKTELISTLVLCSGASLWAQDSSKPSAEEMHRLHQNSQAYIAFLEDPKRDEYQKPHGVIMTLDLKDGSGAFCSSADIEAPHVAGRHLLGEGKIVNTEIRTG